MHFYGRRAGGMRNTTRKNSTPIKVWVLPEEKNLIEENARATGRSVSSYLRAVGIGYQPKSVLDHKSIADLVKVNADLGRLGGLLKMWLANDEKLEMYEPVQIQQTIHGVLAKIGEVQLELLEKVKKI
jgi:hypothetical protein